MPIKHEGEYMKKPLFVAALFAALAACSSAAAQEEPLDSVRYASLVSGVSAPQAPVARGRQVVFTASGGARHVGIAFAHEDYSVVHSFTRLVPRDGGGAATLERPKNEATTLFYIMDVPPETSEIRYRIVRDGLWMPDPLNPASVYDFEAGGRVSVVKTEPYTIYRTAVVEDGLVRFIYQGESGDVVRLAGSFNGWDPFMYEMREFEKGKYELYLPLPKGTWHYVFFIGAEQIRDESISMKVYTRDGRIASVITVD